MKYFIRIACLLLAMSPVISVAASAEINRDVNRLYDVFVRSYYHLDPIPLETLYTEDACMMGNANNTKFYRGKEAILEAVNKLFAKVRKRDANIMISFRVVSRHHIGDVVTDSGYYLVRFTPHEKSEQPVSEFAGKYMFNFMKTDDGSWKLYSDSSTTSKSDLFYSAQSETGLYYSELQQMIAARIR